MSDRNLAVAAIRRDQAERLVASIKPWQRCYPKLKSFSADVVEIVGEDNGGHPMPLFSLCCPEADSTAITFLVLMNAGWPARDEPDEMPHISLPERRPEADGEHLRGWRICERLGLGEAARLAGVSVVDLSEMERGRRPFDLHAFVQKIKEARRTVDASPKRKLDLSDVRREIWRVVGDVKKSHPSELSFRSRKGGHFHAVEFDLPGGIAVNFTARSGATARRVVMNILRHLPDALLASKRKAGRHA